ncbi:alpha/beta hydrolase family protein [Paeniglutamicibacter psychrophenolicus]|uniref:alpha/beta hydrolase family protein n=1 Tax=Paeniglutamicibacter psychrophenolicus TaxID=257454 RepID=UPI0027868858|nr:alpha/beta hydrolase [Paeniglutamicibacter psychrophenolicus]MDQ0093464.1 putative alpha/beta hydrolase [Paeniglutamicibacter psychrophenolicus]
MDPALDPARAHRNTAGPAPIEITCDDGQVLHGHVFEATVPQVAPAGGVPQGVVVIAAATGVLARYYRRYAAFLAANGFIAVTFDYRGIGASAPATLRGFRARWHDWGTRDIDAALRWARTGHEGLPLFFVGHSFGGFGVGLAPESRHLTRILTVGAQHAHWRDYATGHRARFLARWHLSMPLSTLVHGFFPGKRRGWLEDLPRGVALDWARSRKDFTGNAPAGLRERMREAQRALRTPILAVAPTDDPYATASAMARALAGTPRAPASTHHLEPRDYGREGIGHFGLFHDSYRDTFWRQTVSWLEHGIDPWAASGNLPGTGERFPPSSGAGPAPRRV